MSDNKWYRLFNVALGALASIAADEGTNAEAATYAQNTVAALTKAVHEVEAAARLRASEKLSVALLARLIIASHEQDEAAQRLSRKGDRGKNGKRERKRKR